MQRLSIVVPCYNEATHLRPLIDRLLAVAADLPAQIEILFVDDGSTDETLDRIRSASAEHPEVGYVALSRNFGKEAAILAGLRHAQGDAVVLMDGDLQHPPEIVPRLWQEFAASGVDQVIARRDRTGDSLWRRLSARTFYRGVNHAIDVNLVDGEGDFRLLSRRAVTALLELTEVNRFSKGLFAWIGYPSTVVEYENSSRVDGRSRWSTRSLVNYGVDGIVSFNSRPLRTVIHAGWISVALSVLYLAWVVISTFRFGNEAPGYVTLIAIVTFLGGIQLISLGIIGEYVGRIYLETKQRPHYLVAEQQPATEPAQIPADVVAVSTRWSAPLGE